jgi:hypothetical protein
MDPKIPTDSTLGRMGSRLWAEMTAAKDPDPLDRPLLIEACRIIDRLDKLDRQLDGHDWLRFRANEDATEVTVYVDRVLAEAREQATALRMILADLKKALAPATPEKKGGGVLADLAARRAARSTQASN